MSVINVIKLLDFFLIMHARTLKMLNKKNPCCKYFFICILRPHLHNNGCGDVGETLLSGARFCSSFRRSSANGTIALSFHPKTLLCEWGLASFVSR